MQEETACPVSVGVPNQIIQKQTPRARAGARRQYSRHWAHSHALRRRAVIGTGREAGKGCAEARASDAMADAGRYRCREAARKAARSARLSA